MHVAVIGAGRIGGGVAHQLSAAGHEVMVSFSRDPASLESLAAELGQRGFAGTPREAVEFGEVVVLSVPWRVIPEALEATGPLTGKVLIDTTNQFGATEDFGGRTAARFNAERMPGARYTKSFNTLTSGFQAESAGRSGADRVVQWVCGDDAEAKAIAMALIEDAGFAAVDLGGTAGCAVMEAPRRPGAVYGEEYHLEEARAVVEALAAGRPIPPTPQYA